MCRYHIFPESWFPLRSSTSSPRDCYSFSFSFHRVFPSTETQLGRFSKGCGPPGLSQTFPMLLSQSASPEWTHMEAARNSCTASSQENRERLPPSWEQLRVIVNIGAPVPRSVGSNPGLTLSVNVGLFIYKTWVT